MAIDPIEIVVARAGIADHLPRDHVAIAAIERIGKEAHLHVLDDELEEGFAVDPFELDLFILKALEEFVLFRIGQIRKALSLIFRLAIFIERGERLTIGCRRSVGGLPTLLLGAGHEGWLVIMALGAAARRLRV